MDSKQATAMKQILKYMQWLFFWLGLSSVGLANDTVGKGLPTPDTASTLFTESEFETLRDPEMIDNRSITALAQDTRGLIWIGTQEGLIRYDGYRFRKFAHKAGDPSSLVGNYVFSLTASADGRLWVGTFNDGISVFDPATERFENFRHDKDLPDSLSSGEVSAMASDAQGGMWIATGRGLDYLASGSKRFTHFRHDNNPHSLLSHKINSLLWDRLGHLWVGSRDGLQRLSRNRTKFETIITGKSVQTLFQAPDGKIWLGTRDHGAAWLDSAHQPQWLPLAQLSHPWIASIAQPNPNQIWLASLGGGIIIVSAKDGSVLQTLRHDPALSGSLALDLIKPMLRDRAGWLWVGTWGAGLQRVSANQSVISLVRHSVSRPRGLSHPDVSCILELDDGKLLIGTVGNGIDIFDRQRGQIGGYRASRGQSGALPDATIRALAQTGDGTVWVGTQRSGVVRQLRGSTAWESVPGLPAVDANRLLASRDNSVWVGTGRGVARWRAPAPNQTANSEQPVAKSNPIGRFEPITDQHGKALQAHVNALVEDDQGRIWIGTYNGLWLYEPGSKGIITISADPSRSDALRSDSIAGLLFDSRRRLWVSTEKGLERLTSWDGKLARFEHVSAKLGQAERKIGGNLLEDQQGRIWTEGFVIDLARGRANPFTAADGFNLGSVWFGSYTKTRDGLLLYGGTKGIALIDPERFVSYNYAPPLVVTELDIKGKASAPGRLILPLAQTESNTEADLTLLPHQRNFAIGFSALDYSDPKKNQYQYRLQGYDKDWINTDSDHRTAAYGNLWPGLYTLQVRGSNRNGDWSAHELKISIRVLPVWWKTWWFGLLLLLLTCALIGWLVQVRTRYLRQRQRELKQLVDQRTSQLQRKRAQLLEANQELNEANAALNESNEALNQANTELVLSVGTLRQLGDIGREITSNLDADVVFEALHLYVDGLLDAPLMTIYRLNPATRSLELVFGRDDGDGEPARSIALDSATSHAARVVREREELLLHFEWPDEANRPPGTRQMRTAIFAPLIVGDRVLGVMSIQSDKANAYRERERLIFRNLTAYGAIALANAAAVTALRQAEGQLVQQEKMASLGNLVGGIAHEINTPLGTTLMAISGVQDAWRTLHSALDDGNLSKTTFEATTAEGMEYTALALKTATRAAELVALFKTISVNAESDQVIQIELTTYLQEVATLVHAQLLQNGCSLEVEATPGLCIRIVPEALTEALSRILVNVLDHAFCDGRTGTLRLEAHASGEAAEVIIRVTDNGHGIAPFDLPRVFDPFFTTKSGIYGHVGLGLHVAYNHVTQRLKGQIQIDSVLGQGTCVTIRIGESGPAMPEA